MGMCESRAYTTTSRVCCRGRFSLFLPHLISASALPYADRVVESTAQSSSLPRRAARSLSRFMRWFSVMVWVRRVMCVGVSLFSEGVLVMFCHRATRL